MQKAACTLCVETVMAIYLFHQTDNAALYM